MKHVVFLFLMASTLTAHAHDHIEVGEDPADGTRLGFDGPGFQVAVYVPPGEPFSGYMPDYPGGGHACELTFTTEVNALDPANGARPRVELVSVNGPAGGSFSFWEAGAVVPTWTRPAGWTNAPGDLPGLDVVLNGDNHVHGRGFTMDVAGTYTVVFRAIDLNGVYQPGREKTVTFQAQLPPPLSLRMEPGIARLSFTSRLNFDYDLQICTNLITDAWVTHHTIFGNGLPTNASVNISTPAAFFRIVEY